MCTNPIVLKRGDEVVQFACGRCHECLSLRSTNYVQKYFREAHYRKSLHFVTLTYAPESLPLHFFLVDKYGQPYHQFDPSKDKLAAARKAWHDWNNESGLTFSNCVAFSSLNRKDVRLWIKYYRASHPGLDFSFSFIGEYGKLGRPHYHGCLFGLNDDQVRELCLSWSLGFSDFKNVPLLSDHDDIYSVSNYVAKYMHKGDFELPNVYQGFAERPRVFSSLNLGIGSDFNRLKDWYLAKDRFPDVDVMDDTFSEAYLDLVEERLKLFSLGGKHTQYLCKSLKQRFLTYKYTNENTQKTYRKATNLALALANRLLVRNSRSFESKYTALREFFKGREDAQAQFDSAYSSWIHSEQFMLEDKEQHSKEILHKSLQRSKL